jgi:hypothetical protein
MYFDFRHTLPLIILLFITSCEGGHNYKSFEVKATDTLSVDDSNIHLSQINRVLPKGDSITIYTDNDPGIYKEEDNKVKIKIGSSGEERCSYSSIKSISYSSGKLYVLDSKNGSITTYDMSNGKCLSEYRNSELSQFGSIGIVDGRTFLVRGGISSNLDDGEKILYEKKNKEIIKVGLDYSRLEGPFFSTGVFGPTLSISRKNCLYFHIPFGSNIWKYNLRSDSFRKTNIGRRTPKDMNPEEITTFKESVKITRNSEIIFDLYAGERRIYFSSKKKSEDESKWSLHIIKNEEHYKADTRSRPYYFDTNTFKTIGVYNSENVPYKKISYSYGV